MKTIFAIRCEILTPKGVPIPLPVPSNNWAVYKLTDSSLATVPAYSTATFRFGRTWNTVRIDRLEPGLDIRWHVTGQYHHAPDHLTETGERVDTQISFTLSDTPDGGTLLRFRHDGLTPDLPDDFERYDGPIEVVFQFEVLLFCSW